jgi:hypothetical protein
MRRLSLLLIGLGVIGLALDGFTFVTTLRDPAAVRFSLEHYGGPGPILGALILLLGGLYLFTSSRRED